MSNNPNMQKLGKRKHLTAQKQPDWIFPQAKPAPPPADQIKDKQNKKLAMDLLSRRKAGAGAPPEKSLPSQLLDMIAQFLQEHHFTTANQAFIKERKSHPEIKGDGGVDATLEEVYTAWAKAQAEGQVQGPIPGKAKDTGVSNIKINGVESSKVQAESVGDSSSVDSSSDSSDSDDSIDDSPGDVEMEDAPAIVKSIDTKKAESDSSTSSDSSSTSASDDEKTNIPAQKTSSPRTSNDSLKRKAPSDSESSSSGSDSSSDSDAAPKAKKVKVSSASSSSKLETSPPNPGDSKKEKEPVKAEESSDDDSSSSSDSDSDSSTHFIAKKIPLPASSSASSGSSSDSSSDSDSDSVVSDNIVKKPAESSDTSGTLSNSPKKLSPVTSTSSSGSSSSSDSTTSKTKLKTPVKDSKPASIKISDPPLPPNPILKGSKKGKVPFSRISADIKVDNRLASNAYVPYDYAQKAHEDLVVTKGKGFTKEKNKKKRGSYKGGNIDVQGKKGIKFED